MKKLSKIFVLILITSISINYSCSKYEDGPKISLLPKKVRISKEWKIEYSVNLKTGIEHSADFSGWLLTIDKGGAFSSVSFYNLLETSISGNWAFVGTNQIRFNYSTVSGEQIDFYTILRLSRKEFWIKNDLVEIHYYSE